MSKIIIRSLKYVYGNEDYIFCEELVRLILYYKLQLMFRDSFMVQ